MNWVSNQTISNLKLRIVMIYYVPNNNEIYRFIEQKSVSKDRYSSLKFSLMQQKSRNKSTFSSNGIKARISIKYEL